jgi:hypothetical protein
MIPQLKGRRVKRGSAEPDLWPSAPILRSASQELGSARAPRVQDRSHRLALRGLDRNRFLFGQRHAITVLRRPLERSETGDVVRDLAREDLEPLLS